MPSDLYRTPLQRARKHLEVLERRLEDLRTRVAVMERAVARAAADVADKQQAADDASERRVRRREQKNALRRKGDKRLQEAVLEFAGRGMSEHEISAALPAELHKTPQAVCVTIWKARARGDERALRWRSRNERETELVRARLQAKPAPQAATVAPAAPAGPKAARPGRTRTKGPWRPDGADNGKLDAMRTASGNGLLVRKLQDRKDPEIRKARQKRAFTMRRGRQRGGSVEELRAIAEASEVEVKRYAPGVPANWRPSWMP